MTITRIRIDGHFFYLDPHQDTEQLRADVLAAGTTTAYVHFLTVGRGKVSVLMSPGMPARFEELDVSAAEQAELGTPAFPDMDMWDGHPQDD